MQICHSTSLPGKVPAREVSALLNRVSVVSLRRWVEQISIPRHPVLERGNNRLVAQWLTEQLEAWNYRVTQQGTFGNVLAWPRTAPREMVLVAAHYDSVPRTPGADDNASAVAALLGCAGVCATLHPPPPVCFAAFNYEEDNLQGSLDFVQHYLKRAPFKILQTHVLEMVGFASRASGSQRVPTSLPIAIPAEGDFLGLLANPQSDRDLDFILSQARTYLAGFSVIGLKVAPGAEKFFPVLGRSDHVSFWRHGLSAVMWTDTAEFRNPHYHRPSDLPETLDYDFLRKVTQLLVACVCEARLDG